MWHIHDGSDWIWMTLTMALVWVPIVLLSLWAIGRGFSGPTGSRRERSADEDPRAIARRAYARGEFTRERFLEILEDLDRPNHATAGR